MLEYDVSSLPTQNYHLSLAKTIMDQWEIATAEIEYGVDIFHVMETTKFLSASQLSWRSLAHSAAEAPCGDVLC